MRSAIVLFIYAILLLAGGLYAYSSAPDGANATTALIVPGACAALIAILATGVGGLRRGRGARALHIAALVLILLFAAAFSMRAMAAGDDVRAYRNASTQLEQAIASGQVANTPEARRAYFESQNARDHDKSYLANTLWGLVVVSALALIVGIVTRPPAATSDGNSP